MREGEWNWAWFLKTKPGLTGKIIACCLRVTLDLSMAASSEALLAEAMAVRKRAL